MTRQKVAHFVFSFAIFSLSCPILKYPNTRKKFAGSIYHENGTFAVIQVSGTPLLQ